MGPKLHNNKKCVSKGEWRDRKDCGRSVEKCVEAVGLCFYGRGGG